jgi:hypothetical protein
MAVCQEETDDIFLACRYGDLDEIKEFVSKWGKAIFSDLRDNNGSCVLHMVSANGHVGE